MRCLKWCCAILIVGVTRCASTSSDRTAAALKELAPTGKLRAAIGVSPAASPNTPGRICLVPIRTGIRRFVLTWTHILNCWAARCTHQRNRARS